MPDEDPGDVFLRHRGAVLDALLSDPAFGQSTPAPAAPAPDVEPDIGVGAETGAALTGSQPSEPGTGGTYSEPVSAPRRPSGGPKASDRIMALLNGQSPDSQSSGIEFTSDYAETAGNRLAAPPKEAEKSAEPERAKPSEPQRPAGAAGVANDVLIQLRKPKVALIAGGVLAVLLVLVLMTTGGKEKGSDQVVVVTPVAAAPASPQPSASGKAAAPGQAIQVRSAKAHCPSGSTDPMDAFGGQTGKAWSCVRAYKLDGQVLTIDLGKNYKVDSIGIVPGWDSVGSDGSDQWNKYRTVSRVSYQFNDSNASTYTQQTLDQRSLVVTNLEPAVSASKITLTVLESKGDPSTNTTAISSIVITGQ
ncbi:hypothetical protein [Nocardia mexicana]|uniref:F5/8 type C domain-containing protein n=1 Tax=Nocardia mexicana TaxID=279262 RepID=A0A370HCT3_9NOCA|nr:hypothetical protein [Nocardia mexicana]RDI54527.1 hypothetical protein DFR68_102655 [Nocardia mexicana]